MADEKPWWWPKLTDDKWIAQIRKDYSEDVEGLDDDTIRDEYADGTKYANFGLWDHRGDAYEDFENLADEFFALRIRTAALEAEIAGLREDRERLETAIKFLFDVLDITWPDDPASWLNKVGELCARGRGFFGAIDEAQDELEEEAAIDAARKAD